MLTIKRHKPTLLNKLIGDQFDSDATLRGLMWLALYPIITKKTVNGVPHVPLRRCDSFPAGESDIVRDMGNASATDMEFTGLPTVCVKELNHLQAESHIFNAVELDVFFLIFGDY